MSCSRLCLVWTYLDARPIAADALDPIAEPQLLSYIRFYMLPTTGTATRGNGFHFDLTSAGSGCGSAFTTRAIDGVLK